MKAQRRHDLQTNSLAKILSDLPAFFRQHGAKVFLGIVIIGLAVILIRQRMNLAEQEVSAGWSDITSARVVLENLAQPPRYGIDEYNRRREGIDQATRYIRTATRADDRALAAKGLVVQGDMNWVLANLPAIPGAATQPALTKGEPTASEYLTRAKDSYNQVLRGFSQFPLAVADARFGLAACAENEHDWDKAAEHYKAILNDASLAATFKPLVEYRLKAMEQVKAPLYFATLPATQPATTQAATAATSAPAAGK